MMPNSGKSRVGTGHYNDTTLASHILLDSRNENLPKKRIHRNYAGTPGRETAPGFLLRGRGAAARGVFVRIQKRRQVMPFQKGESGNPAGRPRGARSRTTILLQNLLAADAEAIARKAIDLAKGGDLAALRMCMDRLAPARKTEPVVLDLPPLGTAADTVDAAATIVAAAAAGELTPSEAADLANVIDIYVRALATRGFEERLAKLEGSPAPGTMPADAAA
jgi:Family of unknown function (DUF5681)